MPQRFYIETLGCPKNQVDSDKLVGTLLADGLEATDDPARADLVVVNTCAFIEDARQESIDTILALDEQRRGDARLVVTGCMAERYGDELAAALPEVDAVSGFGVPVTLGRVPARVGRPARAHPGPPEPAPAPLGRAVGLRQDRGGLRPDVRVLRHPQLPRTAAQPRRGVDPRRGRPAGRRRDRAGRAGPGQLRQGPSGRARRRRHRPAGRGGAGAGGPDPAALPVPVRSVGRADRRHRLERRAVLRPLPAARVEAAAAADAALGRRRPVPPPHRRHPHPVPRRGLPVELHRRLPGRDGGGPRPAAGLRRRGAARLVRLLRVQPGGRHVRGRAGRCRPPPVDGRAPGRAARAAGRDHRGAPGRAHRDDPPRARRRARHGPGSPGGPRDRRGRPGARLPGRGGAARRRRGRRARAGPGRRARGIRPGPRAAVR